jgi:hypothetical protein
VTSVNHAASPSLAGFLFFEMIAPEWYARYFWLQGCLCHNNCHDVPGEKAPPLTE